MDKRFASFLRLCLLTVLLAGAALQPQYPVDAATAITVEPLTWNIVGLDSNNPAVGPYRFPVGVRACNPGSNSVTMADVEADFVWLAGGTTNDDSIISLRSGSLDPIAPNPQIDLAPGGCTDLYFEVEVNRSAPSPYNQTRRYRIDVTYDDPDIAGIQTVSSTTPRELFVEHLISQSRNAITDVELNGTSIPAGGSMTLMVGNTYTITLEGGTATQGYNQFEAFINFPNTIFQILSVSTTYSADDSPFVSNPNSKLYADACRWENDPNSPNYRSCVGGDYKAGGSNVVTTYTIKIIGGGGTTQTLNTLLYDFSGSSYHYNADYSIGTRFANIVDPTNVNIAKSFNPNPTNVNGISALTITLTNPNSGAITGYNFSDPLPANMSVANPPNATTTSCGTPTFAPVAGATSISFSNGTIAANGSCTIKVNVTPSTTGSFVNTTNHLFVDSLDTGKFATSTLTVNTTPPLPTPPSSCTTPVELARWEMPTTGQGSGGPPPPYTSKASDVATATASFVTVSGAQSIDAVGSPNPNAWGGTAPTGGNGWSETPSSMNNYFQFALDTQNYGGVYVVFDAGLFPNGDWANPTSNTYVNTSANGGAFTVFTPYPQASKGAWAVGLTASAAATGSSTTTFRFGVDGASKTTAIFYLDDVIFYGCPRPTPPGITKAFSPNPIAVNGVSTLTFTLSNSNTTTLTGATFTDTLPTGLQVAAIPSAGTTCGGTPTWAPTAGATLLTFGSPTGGTIPASGSCTVSVNVTGTAAGAYQNVSGFISSTNGGTNIGSTGSASASLTVISPPSISKLFSPNPILSGGTSTLTLTITNPNQNNALTGVTFTDTFPTTPGQMQVAATPNASTTNCGAPTFASAAGATSISFSNGTIAGGGTCIVKVDVTVPSTPVSGIYANTSSAVSSTNGGTGNTASDTLTVNAPNPSIALYKQVGPTNTGPWSNFLGVTLPGDVFYRFTIENTGDVPLTSVGVNDPTLGALGCTWPAILPVAVAANNNHIAICVVGPFAATSGAHTNTATATGTYNSTPISSTSSSATYASQALTIAKSVTEASFTAAGDLLHYSYVVTNSGFTPLPGPVTVTDNKASVTCPNVSTAVVGVNPGDGDTYLDPGESITCTAIYTVLPVDVTAGSVTNIASASISGVTSNTDSKTVSILRPDLTIIKTNNVNGLVAQNGTFNWTITVTNSGISAASFADTETIMSDALPGVAGYYGAPTITNGATPPTGTINCSIAGTALSCVANGAVALPVGASFSVTFAVTPTTAGSLANTATVDPGGVVTESNEANNAGSNTVGVVNAVKTIVSTSEPSTGFVPTFERVVIGEVIRYRLTTYLPEGTWTNVQITDAIDTGMQFLNDGTATVSYVCDGVCTNSTFTITPGTFTSSTDPTFNLSSVSNPDNDANTESLVIEFNALVLNIVSNAAGGLTRNNSYSISFNGTTITSPAVGVRISEPSITNLGKTVLPAAGPYYPGDTITYTLTYSNGSTGVTRATAFDVLVTDILSANLNLQSVSVTAPTGSTVTNTSTTGVGGVVSVLVDQVPPVVDIASGPTGVTITVVAQIVNAAPAGTLSNTANLTYTSLPGGTTTGDTNGTCPNVTGSCTPGTSSSTTGERNGTGGAPNTYTDTSTVDITVTPRADLSLTKTVNNAAPNVGSNVTFTITVTNAGLSNATNVAVSELLPAGLTYVSSIPSQGTYTSVTGVWAVGTINNGANATLNIVATVTSAGAKNNYAQVSAVDQVDPDSTPNDDSTTQDDDDTVTVTPVSVVIDAVDDDYSGTPINGNTGGNAGNAFTNDTLNGVAIVPAQITANVLTPASNPGVTLNTATGGIDVAAGTPAGTYTIDYEICENINPNNCDTATITIVVTPPAIVAVDDDYSSTPVNGYIGGNAGNAFANDTLNGVAVDPAQITAMVVTPASNPGVTLNTVTGSVDVSAGTPAGTYTIVYQICEMLNPTNCDTATITVVVAPPVIDAVNDDYSSTPINGFVGGNAGNAFTNDTLNSVAVVSAQITATILTPASDPGVTMNVSTGSVDVAAGTPAGTYTINYQICENLNPANCDPATITVVVGSAAINVAKSSTTPSITAAGQVVPYTFTVTNTGNLILTGITVDDPNCTAAPVYQSGDTNTNNSLELTETWIYTCSHTVTQAEVNAGGNLSNTVTVDSTGSGPDADTLDIPVVQTMALTTVKSQTSTGPYAVGDTITYDIVVRNTGNVSLTGVVVNDNSATLGMCTPAQPSTLAPNTTMICPASHVVTQADMDNGSYVNTATGDSDQTTPNTSTVTVNFAQTPTLSVVKEISTDNATWNDTSVNVTIGDTVYYRVRVTNTGNVTLTGLTVDDGMPGCTLSPGIVITGDNDAAFEVGEEWAYTCSVTAVAGTNNNTATADSNETGQDSDDASYTATAALVADPAISKAGNPTQASVGETVTFTLTVTNQGNTPAPNIVVTDVLPAQFDVTAVNVSGAPFGTLVNVTPAIGVGPAPYTVVVTLGGPLNVPDVVTINIVTTVNSLGNPPINNSARLTTTALTDIAANNTDGITISLRSSGGPTLPATGFAPNVVTTLPAQPQSVKYSATDVVLEIPSLGVKIPIVGVPKKNEAWDVTWLGKQAGWLEGTAFPSWDGNSVLTSHVYLSNGLPGPFVNLNKLKYGDKVIIHAYGQKYIFEIRTNAVVGLNDVSIFKHEEKSWLTLVTCKEYDEKTNTYKKRVVVRAVLVSVEVE